MSLENGVIFHIHGKPCSGKTSFVEKCLVPAFARIDAPLKFVYALESMYTIPPAQMIVFQTTSVDRKTMASISEAFCRPVVSVEFKATVVCDVRDHPWSRVKFERSKNHIEVDCNHYLTTNEYNALLGLVHDAIISVQPIKLELSSGQDVTEQVLCKDGATAE